MVNHFRHVAANEGIAGRLLCTGYVSEEVMLRLYQATELLCFPSLLEGYGLPVAEAMACGAVAIVSDVDPLRDLVTPEARFDPYSSRAISDSIVLAIEDKGFRDAALSQARAGHTTWAQVADRAAKVYDALLARPGQPWRPRRPRVAVVSPFPPVASGIANYSFRLVEELAAAGDLDIDCFADGLDRCDETPVVPAGLAVYDARSFLRVEAATAGYDQVLYVLGNGEFHTGALGSLRRRPGVVLAHEVRLSGLYHFAAGSKAAVPDGLAATIRRIYGPMLPSDLAATGEVTAIEAERYGLLMAREVIGLCERFLVTSQAAGRLARLEAGPELASRVGVVGFATDLPRARQGDRSGPGDLGPGARVVASFGIVDPIKQPHKLVWAFARLAAQRPEVVLGLVGPVSQRLGAELADLGRSLGLDGRLFITGRVDTSTYLAWLDRVEIAVQLRESFSGEASAAAGDCLAAGVPMIVSDLGWMGELPDGAAFKVSVDVTPDELAEACGRLLDKPAARSLLASGARSYAEEHNFSAAARA